MAYAVPLLDECNCLWLLKKSLQGQKLPKSDDQKCIPRRRKSFIGHPSASSFLREEAKRVFQQPRLLSTVTDEGRRCESASFSIAQSEHEWNLSAISISSIFGLAATKAPQMRQ